MTKVNTALSSANVEGEDQDQDPAAPADGTPTGESDASSPPTPGSSEEIPEDWKNWVHHIPEELKSDETLNRFKTTADIAKAYLDVRKKIGNSLAIPNNDSTKEEIADFYDKLGRPSEADAYKLPDMEMPEDIAVTKETTQWFKDTAYKLGLSQLQTENLYRDYHSMLRTEHDDGEKKAGEFQAEAKENLKKDWGQNYEHNIDTASRTAQSLFSDEAISLLNDVGLGDDPIILKAFYDISKKIGGDSIRGTTGDRTIIEEKNLNEQREELLNNPEYWKSQDLQDKAARINELIALKDG